MVPPGIESANPQFHLMG